MSFKSLFVTDEEGDKKETVKQTGFKFPVAETAQVSTPFFSTAEKVEPAQFTGAPTAEHLDNARTIYSNAFENLNKPGFDFYEYFQSVAHGGINNPQTYTMAFAMGSAMEKTLTKDLLLQQADYYIGEINKGYNDFIQKGSGKKQALVDQKTNEAKSLTNELDLMRQQLEALQLQISDRQNKLQQIDTKYGPQISEVDSKLAANDTAKNELVGAINQVKQGITNNLK
jgi:hypothetical protein